MRIGELAAKSDCSVETIRYYERTGLLKTPARSGSNYRTYGPAHLQRLRFIRQCRLLDMAHDEIRLLLQFCDAPNEDCREVDDLLERHIGHVTTRIRHLKRLERELKALRAACAAPGSGHGCGILLGLAGSSTPLAPAPSGSDKGHVRGAHAKR